MFGKALEYTLQAALLLRLDFATFPFMVFSGKMETRHLSVETGNLSGSFDKHILILYVSYLPSIAI